MGGPRRRAREIALQILFQMDAQPELSADAALRLYRDHFGVDEEGQTGEEPDAGLLEGIVRGVAAERAALDEKLTALSRNWRLERMAAVDRNVLRLALWELLHQPAIPSRVTLNEAIELAKRFGAAEAGAFVNGLLDRALGELAIGK